MSWIHYSDIHVAIFYTQYELVDTVPKKKTDSSLFYGSCGIVVKLDASRHYVNSSQEFGSSLYLLIV